MSGARPKILLVDDTPSNLTALRYVLKRVHTEVVEAQSGAEALQKSLNQEFALVLLDVCMPEMDGYEVAELFRGHPAQRHTPIIFLTANSAENQHIFRGYQAGAVDYIFRPVDDAILLSKVKVFLDLFRARGELKELSHRNEAILSSAGEGIIGLDGDGRVEFANPAALRMLGYDEGSLLGRLLQKFLVERREGNHRAWQDHRIMRSLRRVGGYRSDKESFRRANETTFPVEFTVTPVSNGGKLSLQCVVMFQDITRRCELESRLVHLACYDPLTGFVNRSQFQTNLNDAVSRAKRHATGVAVLFIDVDQFKTVNDTLGHDSGDRLLVQIAERLKHRFREVDKIGRFGGDEFMLMLEDIRKPEDAQRIAEEVIELFTVPFQLDQQDWHVTVSIGTAVYPEAGADIHSLIKHADAAMYKAKTLGRNRCFVFNESMREDAKRKSDLGGALHRAVENRELELFYQPRIELQTGEIVGVEALVRWNHPDLGRLAPGIFIPLAEESGAIGALGEWVLRQACSQVRLWRVAGLWRDPMSMSVNLSALELHYDGFVANLAAVLADFELAPCSIELELTETSVMQQLQSFNILDRLSEKGIKLAIDDFGTGYSSLSYLKKLPVKTLKIDQSFVRDVSRSANDAAIINAIISMAESLNLAVVAEGVETAEQARFLQNTRCGQAQGFFYSQPVDAQAASELLKQRRCVTH